MSRALLVDGQLPRAVRPVFRNRRRHHASPSLGRRAPDPSINIDSLAETLEGHRFANRSLVRRVRVRSDERLAPLDLPQTRNGLPQTFVSDARRASQQLRQLTKDLAKLNHHEMKARYPNVLRNSLQTVDGEEFSSAGTQASEQQAVQCGWLQYLDDHRSGDGCSRLGDELRAFELYMSEIPQEVLVVQRVIDEVETVLEQVGDRPGPRPMLVGSRYTGMALRHSNIDLLIPIDDPDGSLDSVRGPSATRPKITSIQMDRLTQTARLLRATGTFSSVTVDKPHAPVVSAVHTPTDRKVQIHSGVKPHSGLEYVLNYISEYPMLRPLYIAVRMILETRNMHGADKQSLDSYNLIMLIVAALKLGEGTFDRLDLGRQFLHVLRFYEEAKLRRHGISVDPPGFFKKRAHAQGPRTDLQPHVRGQLSIGKKSLTRGSEMLCLQDPADFMNDLGVTCSAPERLRQVLGAVHADVLANVRAWDGEAEGGNEVGSSVDPKRLSLLRFALGSNYNAIDALRDKAIFEAA